MTNVDISNNKDSNSKEEEFEIKKPKPISALKLPSVENGNRVNSNIFCSGEKNNLLSEYINSSFSIKSKSENVILSSIFNHKIYKNMTNSHFPLKEINNNKFNNDNMDINDLCFRKLTEKGFYFCHFEKLMEEYSKIKNEETKLENGIENNKIVYNYQFFNELNDSMDNNYNYFNKEKNINLNLYMNLTKETNNSVHNVGTKFFTNHNYGYKCSCSKTQCNRKYCECFNSGNYCIDCNCKNCTNKPPVNIYTNKHPTSESLPKKAKLICTCTKSSCNKNYCECFKSGQKCTSLCRCISCENNDASTRKKKKDSCTQYQCCMANSIYIIKNKIYIEDIKNLNIKSSKYKEKDESKFERDNSFSIISKKRKRVEAKKDEEINIKKKKDDLLKEQNNLFNEALFGNDGNIVLKCINLIHM